MEFVPIAESAIVGAPDWFLSGAITTSNSHLRENVRSALVAFSSKPYVHIFLVKLRSAEQHDVSSVVYVGQIQAHHERISGLSFCESVNSSPSDIQLFSCGQDGLVRHWSYHSHEWLLTKELNIRAFHESLLPTCLDTTVLADQVLTLVGTNKGTLLVWCVFALSTEPVCLTKKFENDSVTTCAWEPCNLSGCIRLAIGYKKGIIGVYLYQHSSVTAASSLTQLSRFYAHERDICHVIWNPSAHGYSEVAASEPELLSTGRDQMVKIWNIASSWCCDSVRVPGSARSIPKEADSSNLTKNQSTGAPWISACWLPAKTDNPGRNIVVSGLRGELYTWSDSSQLVRLHTENHGHSMLVFAIRSIPDTDGLFFTIGQDRQVILWIYHCPTDLTFMLRVPTIAAGISALAQSDHGHGPVAAGVADGSILLWRHCSSLQEESSSMNPVTSYWPRGVHGSCVTALAWHPSVRHESLLAYGTESGCVELIDTSKIPKSATQRSKTQPYIFGSTVYRVAWGPPLFTDSGKDQVVETAVSEQDANGSTDSTDTVEQKDPTNKPSSAPKFSSYIYSVCKGKIFCHVGFQRPPLDVTLKFPSVPGISTEDWVNDKRTDIAFLYLENSTRSVDSPSEENEIRECFSCLITVGYRSGSVDVYGLVKSKERASADLIQPLCRISCHTKGVNCLAWSFDRYWLAIGTNESFITVIDVGHVLKQATKPNTSSFRQISTHLAHLEGHGNRITCLDWSPHENGLLLSASFDGTANVWRVAHNDTDSGSTSVANFRAHRLRLFACLWSRQEADLAFSGGELCHLFSWRPSKLAHKEPPNSRRYRPPPVKRVPIDSKDLSVPSVILEPSAIVVTSQEVNRTEYVPEPTYHTDTSIGTSVPLEPPVRSVTTKKPGSGDKRKRPSLCPHFLHRSSLEPSTTDLGFCPPFRLGSRFLQVSHVLNLLKNDVDLPESDCDLLFLLPETNKTRPALVRFLTSEATHHLSAYRATQRSNGLMHLDAYCIILLWLGRTPLVAQTMCSEKHMPFWLLWAVQLAQTTVPAFSASRKSSGDHAEIDLAGEKVKDMTSNSPDVLVSSTLLVCAGRHQEAVDYLFAQDRVKEALLLARLRLGPLYANSIMQKCIARIIERRLCPEVPFARVLHELGAGEWERAQTVLRQATVVSLSRQDMEVEQVASSWVELNILLSCSDNSLPTNAFVRFALSCLVVGFQLPEAQSVIYFQRCQEAVTPSAVLATGTDCFRLLLNTGLRFAAILTGSSQSELYLDMGLHADVTDIVQCLRYATLDRQPANRWSACASQLALDFTIYLLSSEKLAPQDQSTEDLNRLEASLRLCSKVNPTNTQQLSDILFHFQTSPELDSPLKRLLPTVLRPSENTDEQVGDICPG
ncbi:Gem-associated protein 5 [Clonorchis sinensis]|uniref:Gem-associated protein 5 n=1 Tax=Clonorchis sinensis TaxID=79923 RepID=A0A8T1M2I9_CLOSI|nr:Gem-associated protein 5 [Clonorchis sinensis]